MKIKFFCFLLGLISLTLPLPTNGVLNKVYVTTDAGAAVINTLDNTYLTTVPINSPLGIAMYPTNQAVYVVSTGDNTVSIIETNSDTMIGTIPLVDDKQSFIIALTPDGKKGYISNFSGGPSDSRFNDLLDGVPNLMSTHFTSGPGGTVSVIDTINNTFIRQVTVGLAPLGVVASPDSKFVYVSNALDDTISIIDTATDIVINAFVLAAGTVPGSLAISPDGKQLYVTAGFPSGHNVLVLNAQSGEILNTINVPAGTLFIALSPDGTIAYVTSGRPNQVVSVIDIALNRVISIIPTGGDAPLGVAFLPISPRAYVANNESRNVTVIDTNTNIVIPPIIDVIEKCFLVAAPLGVQSPSNFKAKVIKNEFATQSDLINHLTWDASLTPSVEKYNLFRNGHFIASFKAHNRKHFSYNDHNRKKRVKYVYKLVAVGVDGSKSVPVRIEISG